MRPILILLLAASITSAQDIKAVVNAASFTAQIAPGSLISIFGTNLQNAQVRVNGQIAPIFYSGPTQINAQLPFEVAPGAATLTAGASTIAITVESAAPGIFNVVYPSVRPGQFATIYLTGQGEVLPAVPTGQPAPLGILSRPIAAVTATLGGLPAEIQFAGLAPGYAGLMQVNLRVPQLAAGSHPVVVTIGGARSNAVQLSVDTSVWQSALKVSRTGSNPHAGRTYASSSSLHVEWQAPAGAVHHYAVTAAEQRSSVTTDATATDVTLRNLKAGTAYTISLRACLDAQCTAALAAPDTMAATTEEEYWAVQGRGNSYATADHLVADGNVGSYAMKYGPWAGAALDGKVQLYYTPMQPDEKGIKLGETVAPKIQAVEDALSFRGVSGYGLLRVCQSTPQNPALPAECSNPKSLATGLALFQAIPLPVAEGGKVRLYFEAQGGDGRTRILYLDSQDGYVGRDFNTTSATRCNTLADYSSGGACEPRLAIGVDIDAGGNPNVLNARQFKIFYPTQETWVWDMKPGTAMWFTTEWPDRRCSTYGFNAAYAVWSGAKWDVGYQTNGCPKLLAGAQAPAPVHLGGARYKLYVSLHPTPGGPSDPRVSIKPMRMIYADPEASGDPAVADFEDWEPLTSARQIHYLWPTGELLTEDEESRFDDFVVFAPTNDPAKLVMYSNMSATGTQSLPFIGSAVLINP